MHLSLNKAAKEAGISKSTLSEALNSGRLTANKDSRGRWQIDPAALFHAFPKTTQNEQIEPQPNINRNTENLIKIERLEAELEAAKQLQSKAEETADYLQKKLGSVDVQDSHLMLSLIQGCKQEESSLDPFRSNRCPVGAD